MAHSGAVCPGLIEAKGGFDRFPILCPRIPGQSAPASLKRTGGRRSVPAKPVHSGAVCPGLIEAALNLAKEWASLPGILGQSAPASLKPVAADADPVGDDMAFRGSLPRPH